MEGFWDILKRERYYGRRFTSKQDLIQMIERYIRYYPTRRVQRNLGVMPLRKAQTLSCRIKSGQQFTLLVGKILFFHCPLDGERFRKPDLRLSFLLSVRIWRVNCRGFCR